MIVASRFIPGSRSRFVCPPRYFRSASRNCAHSRPGTEGVEGLGCVRPAAVIFDLGKVLLDFDFRRAADGLAHDHDGVSAELILELFGHGPTPPGKTSPEWSLVEQYERGVLDTHAFYEAVVKASGLKCGLPQFIARYADIFTPIPAMIEQQQLLQRSGIHTFLLSNCSDIHIRHVREKYPFFSSFDGYILSYQERSYKPEEEIYRAAERLTGLAGQQLCFIDDKAENVEGAKALGWSAIHHRDVNDSLQELAELGLPVIDHS